MRSTKVQQLARVGFAAGIAAFAPAASCGDGGERNQTEMCPAGEVCSPQTEDGLHFVGATIGEGLFDSGGVKPVATGGTQSIEIELSLDGERTPLDLAYDATIEGGAVTIETRHANELVLRGAAPSEGHLRITDPADGTLFDRIAITSQTITQFALSPTFIDRLAGTRDGTQVLYAPGATAYVGLTGTVPLVDESMQITGSGVTQTKWDQVRLGALAPGMHPITVDAGGQTAQLQIPVVAGPDRLEMSWGSTRLEVGKPDIVCYAGFLGTRYVHVPWSFTAVGADVEDSYLEGCVNVTARKTGSVVIRVRGGELLLDHSIRSVHARRSTLAESPDPAAEVATAGERAATVAAWMLESTR